MHVAYPLSRVEDINDDLADAIAFVLGAGDPNTPVMSLADVLQWHRNANTDDNYNDAIRARVLELANALQLNSITNGDPEKYKTFQTDSDYHNKLLMSLGIYTDEDRWDDDFQDYRNVGLQKETVSVGLPFLYHPDFAEKAYRLHRISGWYGSTHSSANDYYTCAQMVHALEAFGTAGELECGAVALDNELIHDIVSVHNGAAVPLRWALAAETEYQRVHEDTLTRRYTVEQLQHFAAYAPEEPAEFYTFCMMSDLPPGRTYNSLIECYLDIRDGGYPADVAMKGLLFGKPGKEVVELYNTLTVEYALRLI